MKKDLAKICFPVRFLNDIKGEKVVVNFSIAAARKAACTNALVLSVMNTDQKITHIQTLDLQVSKIAQGVLKPGYFINLFL